MKFLLLIAIAIFCAGGAMGQVPAGSDEEVETASVVAESDESPATPGPDGKTDSGGDAARKAAQTQDAYTRPEPKKRFRNYINSMVGPMALAQRAAQSGVGTWRNSPEEWGSGWEGFGRRFASGTGKSVIKNSAMYGLDEVLKVDSRFYRSEKRDVGSRIKNALISPVTARRPDGSRTIGIPRLVGTYTANVVAAETWYPARYDWKDGMRSGTISLGFNAAFNLVKEFIWKK